MFLAVAILIIIAANLLGGVYQFLTNTEIPPVVDVADEASIPTWYNSLLLALAGGLAALVARVERRRSGSHLWHWRGLALAMFFTSMDEVVQGHERIDDVVPQRLIEPFGAWITVHPWVIFALPAVLLLGALYIPFLRALPSRARWLFLLAGTTYVAGALGAESLHGAINVYHGGGVFTSLATLLEESLEMAGVVIFIYALCDHLSRIGPHASLELR